MMHYSEADPVLTLDIVTFPWSRSFPLRAQSQTSACFVEQELTHQRFPHLAFSHTCVVQTSGFENVCKERETERESNSRDMKEQTE